jgi:NADH-quinone oxidoreductase subunit N
MAASAQKEYLLVFIALLNTIISLYYYLLVVKAMFINNNDQPIERFSSDNYMKIALVICFVGMIALGFTSIVYEHMGFVGFGL